MGGDQNEWWMIIQGLAALTTTGATIALGYFTWVLARETQRLSKATAQAHVVATIEPNLWAAHHADLVITNTGNAAAYDVELQFEPQLPGFRGREDGAVPFGRISVLKPGYSLGSHLSEFGKVSKQTYNVSVTWKLHPDARELERLSYQLAMKDYEHVSYLGARSPLAQIAEQLKKLREDWQQVARGSRKLAVNSHSEADRRRERKQLEELWSKQELEGPSGRNRR